MKTTDHSIQNLHRLERDLYRLLPLSLLTEVHCRLDQVHLYRHIQHRRIV